MWIPEFFAQDFLPLRPPLQNLAPVLLLEERKQMQIVNYRVRDGCYVVDRLFQKAVMINGVGKHQQRVEIRKEPEKRRRRRRR